MVEYYEDVLYNVASHGFVVLGVDPYFPVYDLKETFKPPKKVSEDVDKYFQEYFWKFMVNKITSTILWNTTGLMCHSSSCDDTLLILEANSSLFQSTIFLEPVSSHINKGKIDIKLPALMYGTELSEQGIIKCVIPGEDYNKFYDVWTTCPRIVMEVAFYEELLTKVASHGFVVLGADYDFPIFDYNRKPSIPKLKSAVDKFLEELSWVRQSTIFLEPASYHVKEKINVKLPALMYGTEYSEEGHKCAIPGYDYDKYYDVWSCPRIVMNVANFGHCDILDPVAWKACHATHFCKTTNDPSLLPGYKQFVQGVVSAFFITHLQGGSDMSYITNKTNIPLAIKRTQS
ncbi:hypothetical protein KUTeg_019114 [Tegillarca granosa]|uniref:Uncharacterized protein n=1 Tax=Tegillarca granosa TaxID=220873 RepID=A0ABQ9EBK9_TEGGR|nr:hypothetical protein KUTeg_019114 [Tegillarca granosa]